MLHHSNAIPIAKGNQNLFSHASIFLGLTDTWKCSMIPVWTPPIPNPQQEFLLWVTQLHPTFFLSLLTLCWGFIFQSHNFLVGLPAAQAASLFPPLQAKKKILPQHPKLGEIVLLSQI